jgi:hypothetical protein
MIIYNISCHLSQTLVPKYEEWVAENLVGNLNTLPFVLSYKQLKLLTQIEEQLCTYIYQFQFESILHYNQFEMEQEAMLLNKFTEQFGTEVYCFTTLMQEID